MGAIGAQQGAMPNLVVIGAMKCGTSSLHRYLDLHPEISMSLPKEPNYFLGRDAVASNRDRGVEWYRSLFDRSAAVRGEASVNYTSLPASEGTAERMAEELDEPKLIYLVRDPIERAISHYLHARAAGREPATIDEALSRTDSRYTRRGSYASQLQPFLEVFERDRIMIVAQERLLSAREQTLREIFAFLGVDNGFSSEGFRRLWEVSAGKTRKFTLAYRISGRLGGHQRWGSLPPQLRWLAERAAFHPTGGGVRRPDLAPAVRRGLEQHFRPEAERLRAISGLSLDRWSV